jgi:hypothetical protein
MSVLDDFARMHLYRNRAAEFEELANTALFPTVQRRFHTIARHYRELAEREEQSDNARFAEHLELLRRGLS